MSAIREWTSRLLGAFRAGRSDADVAEELRSHLELADADARSAKVRHGGAAQAMEAVRDQRGLPWLEDVARDLRYGVRVLSRNAGFTAVALVALVLGIGVNTAVFTAYKAMVARPLDARNPGELANIAVARRSATTDFTFSYPDYEAYRDSVRSFSGLAAYSPERMTLSGAGAAVSQRAAAADSALGRLGVVGPGAGNVEFASVFVVSENFFTVFGVAPSRGRAFDSIAMEELLASPPVLISENFWTRRFGANPAVLGQTIRLNGASVTVIGTTPRDFVGAGISAPDFWMPISLEPLVHANDALLRDRENNSVRLFGRLASGATMSQAQAEITLETDRLRALHDPRSKWAQPATALVWPGSPFPLPFSQYRGLTFTIVLIMAATLMVLVVACANVASLQLARARSRQTELRTRISLGASRLRVIRQLLTESALLGLMAGGLALLFAWASLQVAVTLLAGALPPEYGTLVFRVTPDLAIFSYALVISLFAAVLFGLAPALEGVGSGLSSSERTSTSAAGSRRLQNILVAAQVSLSLVLLIAGSLLVRSAIHAITTDPGYDAKRVVDLELQFPESSTYTAGRKTTTVGDLRARLGALPGVTAVTSARPPGAANFVTGAVPVDASTADSASGAPGGHRAPLPLLYGYVEANYFQTLGITLSRGRVFESGPGESERSVILSESAARSLWPDQDPVGRTVRLGATDEKVRLGSDFPADGSAYQVIGVARDTRGVQFDGSGSRQVYLASSSDRFQKYGILIRTDSDPAGILEAIDPLIASIDPDLAATSTTLQETLRRSGPFVVSSISAAVASTIGLLGLLLASMGIYGTVSYIVVLRTHELGIRMAVGAQPRDILGLILFESTRPVLVGLAVGMLLAVGASYLLRGLLYGLNTVDVVSFAGVSLLFLTIALLAAYPPSRRAMRVDPVVALRYE